MGSMRVAELGLVTVARSVVESAMAQYLERIREVLPIGSYVTYKHGEYDRNGRITEHHDMLPLIRIVSASGARKWINASQITFASVPEK